MSIIIINIKMSSIIDDLLFDSSLSIYCVSKGTQEYYLQNICKIVKINEESILLQKNEKKVQAMNKLKFQNQEFGVRSTGFKAGRSIRTIVSLLGSHRYWRCSSRQNQILLMKQIVKRQKQCTGQSNIFLQNGLLYLALDHFLLVPGSSSVRWVAAYQKIIIKNVLHLEDFMYKHLKIGKRARFPDDGFSDLQSNLLISQILNTTQTTQQILQEKSQYKFARQSIQTQNQQLSSVEKNIISSQYFEDNVKLLFGTIPQVVQSFSLKNHLVNSYQNSSKMLKSLLIVKYPPRKRIDDYVYNKVKAQVVEDNSNGRMVGEGGSCVISTYRMNLTFIGSTGHEQPTNELRLEKMVAVKRPRPNQVSRLDKIAHEKEVVSKLRSSISYFLPKYYEIDKPQLKNCMLMEYISGEELDYYVSLRSNTISFWSKVYIMINVIHGIRHLISYDIVHLDLKPINILVCKSLVTKIIDFGQAYHPDVCPKNYTPGVTFPYAAPEVYLRFIRQSLNRQDSLVYSQKQDVFALGIIMSQIFFGSRVFFLTNSKFREVYATQNLLQRVFYAVERNELYGDDLLFSIIGFIIVRCLDSDPKLRPRVEWVGIILKLMLNSFVNIN